ncbi:MAG: hypothetical protein HUU16_18515, partial [Candidatus Omnitrophica bacterium]|nr:hypothetical protein [Candidatus Omnitrophota bacterium]
MHRAFISTTISVCMLYALSVGASGQVTPEVKTGSVDCVLNGLAISLDRETGGVTHLQYEGVETFLKASKERAGLLDLAFPIPEFEPLRLATRFSTGASVEISGQSVVIAWEKLGSSRAFALPGSVSATVEVRAATDGRSVILTANIHNRSSLPIRQVMFPDLAGLVPFAGADGTVFRTAGSVLRPFRDLQTSDLDRFYATNA